MSIFNTYPLADGIMPEDTILIWQDSTGRVKQLSGSAILAQQEVENITALKALDVDFFGDGSQVAVGGFATSLDGGGGVFVYDSASSATTNLGTIIAPDAGSGRWFRLYSGPLNVKWFGAKGDNTTNDSAAFNATINAASDAGGGTVFVPTATYKIPGTVGNRILLQSNVELIFEAGCIINSGVPASSCAIIMIDTASGGSMSGISIKGNGLVVNGDRSTSVACYGIQLNTQSVGQTLTEVYISDITINNCRTDGVNIVGNSGTFCENIVFERIVCDNNYRNGGSVVNGRKITFRDCWFKNTNGTSPQCGFDVEPDTGLIANDVGFDNCKFSGNAASGLFFQAGLGTTERGFINNCSFYQNGSTGCAVGGAKEISISNSISWGNTGRNWDITNCEGTRLNGLLSKDGTTDGFRFFNQGAISANNLQSIDDGGIAFLLSSVVGSTGLATFTNLNALNSGGRGLYLSFCQCVNVLGGMIIGGYQDGVDIATSHNNKISDLYVAENGRTTDNAYDNVIIESSSNYNTLTNIRTSQARRFHHGTAQSGAAGSVTLATTASTQDDFYNGMYAYITAGTGSGGFGQITDYNGTTKVATVSPDWVTPPDATSTIEVVQNINRPRYGIRINGGCTGNNVTNNDAYFAGVTGAISDAGTGTVTSSANRTS